MAGRKAALAKTARGRGCPKVGVKLDLVENCTLPEPDVFFLGGHGLDHVPFKGMGPNIRFHGRVYCA